MKFLCLIAAVAAVNLSKKCNPNPDGIDTTGTQTDGYAGCYHTRTMTTAANAESKRSNDVAAQHKSDQWRKGNTYWYDGGKK